MPKKAAQAHRNGSKPPKQPPKYDEKLLALGRAAQQSHKKSMSVEEVLRFIAEQRGGRA